MDRIKALIENPVTERVVMTLIVINAITLGLETSKSAMDAAGPLLIAIDRLILAVFCVEIAARIAVYKGRFFRDPWSLFDLAVVAIALIPASESLSVLRALRVLRVLRLITIIPSLKRVVGGLIAALPGMGSVTLLLLLIFYVFAVMATKLFGEDFPELFGTLGASAFTLFQIMTLEGWSDGVVRPIMKEYPLAWLFFIPYILATTFTVLNLFIGIVVNAMQAEHDKGQKEERESERAELQAAIEPLVAEVKALRADLARLEAERTR